MFDLSPHAIDAAALRQSMLNNESCGAFACFEGWVRRQNDGKAVDYLVYSTYDELARTQGAAVLAAAKQLFAIEEAVCVHRYGRLEIGDLAVWVGVSAGHRDAAFAACRFIIDTIKAEVPIWKQEFYLDGQADAWLANAEARSGG